MNFAGERDCRGGKWKFAGEADGWPGRASQGWERSGLFARLEDSASPTCRAKLQSSTASCQKQPGIVSWSRQSVSGSVEGVKGMFDRHKNKIITVLLGGCLLAAVLSIFALLSGAVMKLFGFEYQSPASVISFFIAGAMLSYPLGLIAGALPKALLSLNRLSKRAAKFLYVCLDTLATFLGFRITDCFMPSVSAENRSIIVVSLLIALLGMGEIGKQSDQDE